MQFILDIMEQKRKTTIEDLLLLLLRILMILFLALAVSRPLFQSSALASMVGSDADVVILLDNSYSMGTSQGAQTRWEKAKQQAALLIEEQASGSGIAILLGSSDPDPIVGEFSSDHALLSETLRELPTSALGNDWGASLAKATDIIGQSKKGLKKVYIISDFQELDWTGLDENTKTILKDLHNNNQVTLINIQDTVEDNLTAVRLRLSSGAMRVGSRAIFAADILNHGNELAEDVPVDFYVDGQVIESSSISIGPAQTGTVRFQYEALEEGYHQANVKLRGDSLAEDNNAYLPFNVVESISVLAVTEGQNEFGFLPTQFIELALNPFVEGSEAEDAIYQFNSIDAGELAGEDLSQYAFVCLSGLSAVSSVEASILTEYVQAGGGILMFLGASTDVATYNANLYADGKGLFSWPLIVNKIGDEQQKEPISVSPRNFSHPLWLGLVDHQNDYFKQVKVYSAFTFEAGKQEHALPLADLILPKKEGEESLANPPFIVDFTKGRGHCIVVGSSSDLSMNDFIAHPVFVGFINQTVKYIKTFRDGNTIVHAGSPAVRYVSFQNAQANYVVTAPSGNSSVLAVDEKELRVDIPELREAGFYEMVNQNDSSDRTLLAVNVNPEEGQIAQLGVDEIKALFPDTELNVIGAGGDADEQVGGGGGAELATLLLILVLLCWIGENYLGYRISKR